MINRISYYSPKKRIYVKITGRKIDAYYDIENKEWKPKKIGKDEELLKEIFQFAGVKDIEEFANIRENIHQPKDSKLLAEFKKEKLLNRFEQYLGYCEANDRYYANGFDELDSILDSLKEYLSKEEYEEKRSQMKELEKEKSIEEAEYQFDRWLGFVKDSDGFYQKGIEKCKYYLKYLTSYMDVSEKEKELNEIIQEKTLEEYEHQFYKWFNYVKETNGLYSKGIENCKVYLKKLSLYIDITTMEKEFEEVLTKKKEEEKMIQLSNSVRKYAEILNENLKDFTDFESVNQYEEYAIEIKKKAIEHIVKQIKKIGGLYVSLKEKKENEWLFFFKKEDEKDSKEQYSLAYPENFTDEDKEILKKFVKVLGIGKWDGRYSIDIDINKAVDFGIPVKMVNVEVKAIITDREEIEIPEAIAELQTEEGVWQNTGKGLYVAECTSDFLTYTSFLTKLKDVSSSGKNARYYIDPKHEFKNGYYVTKWGSWKNMKKQYFEFKNGKWYELRVKFKRVIS